MKIKITKELPVAAEVRPEVGGIYEVAGTRRIPTRGTMYTVSIGRGQVGVFENECELIPEEQQNHTLQMDKRSPTLESDEPEL